MHHIVKVGSSSLYQGDVNLEVFHGIAQQVARLHEADIDVTMVTSGAIAMGRGELGYGPDQELALPQEQLAASVGQRLLMDTWAAAFDEFGYRVGQLLVTRDALTGGLPAQQQHAQDLLEETRTFNRGRGQYTTKGIIQIVNENDATDVEQIRNGDNDTLSAYVGNVVGAENLFLLGTSVAICECPKLPESRIPEVTLEEDGAMLELICQPTVDPSGTGGAETKLTASKIFLGVDNPSNKKVVYVASASEQDVLARVVSGDVGTRIKRSA